MQLIPHLTDISEELYFMSCFMTWNLLQASVRICGYHGVVETTRKFCFLILNRTAVTIGFVQYMLKRR